MGLHEAVAATTPGLSTIAAFKGGVSVGDNLGLDLSGEGAAAAAREAAGLQLEGTKLGIEELRAGREQARQDLSPFRQAGQAQLAGLGDLISNPQAQLDFVQNNPFFSSLAQDSQNRLFANQAARGKVGSGGTAEALQNSLLRLGNDLVSQNINQRFNLATMGSNAAAGQATNALSTGRGISDLVTQGSNAQAAGVVGAADARTNARSQLLQLGSSGLVALSDRRMKKDIKKIGFYKDLPIYKFKYVWDEEEQIGFMAQDVQEVMPEAVINIDGILHVDYGVVYGH